jgi:isoquinoline 1-oxidoreductase beta subunit
MPGVLQVVIEEGFAGVVAESRSQAYAGVEALEVDWQERADPWQEADLERLVTVGQGQEVVIQREGEARRVLQDGQPLKAEYRTPLAFHAHLEPMAALADVSPEGIRVWVSTQSAVRVRGLIAEALGREEETVVVTPVFLGGGFGGKVGADAAVEAARLSQAAGRPVHVGWTRREDFQAGFLRPPTHHVFEGVLNGAGRLEAVEHQQSSGPVSFPFIPGFLKTVLGADFGSWRGALIPYEIPHRQTVAWLSELPVPTGWWRGLGLMANTFALESFVDELAHAAGADPLAFRLAHLPDSENGRRIARALNTAAERTGWGSPAPQGRGRGVAWSIDVNTIVAEVAEVSIEGGNIRVERVTAAVDPGLVINPDGAEAQTQGAITMGLSATLLEEALVEDGVLRASNFDRYPLLTMAATPEIDVILLESGESPFGMGEPPIGPIAAAVANAVFDLTGQRLRQLPLRLG